MPIDEVNKRFKIPKRILKKYESWELCGEAKKGMGAWNYDDSDIKCLSMIMTLCDAGFTNAEIHRYMELLLAGESTEKERMRMLNTKRDGTLEEIHFKEKQLSCLDYLRHKVQCNQSKH